MRSISRGRAAGLHQSWRTIQGVCKIFSVSSIALIRDARGSPWLLWIVIPGYALFCMASQAIFRLQAHIPASEYMTVSVYLAGVCSFEAEVGER